MQSTTYICQVIFTLLFEIVGPKTPGNHLTWVNVSHFANSFMTNYCRSFQPFSMVSFIVACDDKIAKFTNSLFSRYLAAQWKIDFNVKFFLFLTNRHSKLITVDDLVTVFQLKSGYIYMLESLWRPFKGVGSCNQKSLVLKCNFTFCHQFVL